ncbi:hypothetical protein L3X38_008323 [Prunus dulcis]|uniref:Uncharacterized protein n=1 Tax=Prunus dulcis TaxID=3755 RepID=A0AAD5F707_PRUDU|nr:hypothetical protein L3X38_008323 [Prunus dulcis]
MNTHHLSLDKGLLRRASQSERSGIGLDLSLSLGYTFYEKDTRFTNRRSLSPVSLFFFLLFLSELFLPNPIALSQPISDLILHKIIQSSQCKHFTAVF